MKPIGSGHPGEAFGCRCYAEPIPPKHPRYEAPSLAPLLALIPANRARLLITAAIRKAGARPFYNAIERIYW